MTLKEFSDLLGLSPTTVSRALGGYPEVSAKTRDRVEVAARTYGYRPNMQAQRLATGRSMAIGHVLPLDRDEMVNPIFGDFLAGAAEVYAQRGYEMVLSIAKPGEAEATYRALADRRRVDAVLLHGPEREDLRPALFDALNVPFVVHGRMLGDTTAQSWLDIDNEGAFAQATAFLCAQGHRRIALINGPAAQGFAYRREQGYRSALAQAGLPVETSLIHADQMTEPKGYLAAVRLLDGPQPPSAFLVSSIMTAMGADRALRERGLTLGLDVDLVTHDDVLSFLPNSGEVPQYTCTRSSVRAAGQRAAEMLMSLIETPDQPPLQDLWQVEFIEGLSTGALSGRSPG
ncbi:MAG: substrate-binding domain-containing protein [Pseudomonadota bacterium]